MDKDIIVCIKPPRVLSTDEPGGLPELLRRELGEERADIRTVHRLDRATSGLMVLARNGPAASELSRQIREEGIGKEYLAVVHGLCPESGSMRDLLVRDKARKMTFVAPEPGKGIQNASLSYRVLASARGMSKVEIHLHAGRINEIRVLFASRGLPLVGERKYSVLDDPCEIALFSQHIGFYHPSTHDWMDFRRNPPEGFPWDVF